VYVDFFSRALNYEYGGRGITIQCLIPYYVATRMTKFSSTLSNPSLFIPTASTYARHALTTLGWSERTTGYWPHTLQVNVDHLSNTLQMSVNHWSHTLQVSVDHWSPILQVNVDHWSHTLKVNFDHWSHTLHVSVEYWSQTLKVSFDHWSYTLEASVDH